MHAADAISLNYYTTVISYFVFDFKCLKCISIIMIHAYACSYIIPKKANCCTRGKCIYVNCDKIQK